MRKQVYELRAYNTDPGIEETFTDKIEGTFYDEDEAIGAAEDMCLYGKIFVYEIDTEDDDFCELDDVIDL